MFTAWKLIPTVLILGSLLAGMAARPPRSPVATIELVRLVLAVAALYLVGGVALLSHRTVLAGVVFGCGLALCALALWLSRGSAEPRDDGDGGGGDPPAAPEPPPEFDWDFYEDQFRQPVS